jgi:cephalosporin hydroxylase
MIPPNVSYDLDAPLRDFWRERLERHTQDFYRGVALAKMPEDLRTYGHLIDEVNPEVIVEIGSYQGGSALWFADQLSIRGHRQTPLVVSVDKNPVALRDSRIEFITADVRDPDAQARVWQLVADRRALVSEDSNHNYVSTSAALRAYADLVSVGSWFVVEDGVVDHEGLRLPRYPHGVKQAIDEFLASPDGERFSQHELAPYGTTTCFGGWLKAEA